MSDNFSNPFDTDELGPSKPDLNIFFMIDTSGSMYGERINQVNSAMKEICDILLGVGGSDANVKVAVLKFAAGTEWLHPMPLDVDQFTWSPLEAEGWTDFGAACDELCSKMSRKAYMHSKVGYKKPIVILITDGEPSDEYEIPLENLWKNRWFKSSLKFALGVDEANMDVLHQFVRSKEGGVYDIQDHAKLKKLMKAIAITSAQIGSKSMDIDINASVNATEEELDEKANANVYAAVDEAVESDDWD